MNQFLRCPISIQFAGYFNQFIYSLLQLICTIPHLNTLTKTQNQIYIEYTQRCSSYNQEDLL